MIKRICYKIKEKCCKKHNKNNFSCNYCWWFLGLLFILILVVVALWTNSLSHDHEITLFHDILLVLLTFGIFYVAFRNLGGMNKTTRSDFLLRIDERYSSKDMTQARKIIHEFYCRTKIEKKFNEGYNGFQEYKNHIEKISEEIKRIGIVENRSNDFMALLNFLDFLETISYFAINGLITNEDIQELLGNSIMYYFNIFGEWIYVRREKYNDKKYYCKLEELVSKLSESCTCKKQNYTRKLVAL